MTTGQITNQAYENWYQAWISRIDGWAMDCGVKSTASAINLIPDLLQVLLHLSSDPRVPAPAAEKLAQAANDTMRGIDFLPDGFAGVVGLVDDTVAIAKVLEPVLPTLDPAVIKDYWQGSKSLAETVHYLLNESDDFSPRC